MSEPDKHDHAIVRPGNRSGAVFVHGILGHYTESWIKFPSLLSDDSGLVHYNFHFWGYPSSKNFFHIPFIGKKAPTISQVAEAFVTYLEYDKLTEYVDLVLIGHSMGGLVIRQAILHALKNPKKHAELLAKIRHVILFASPSEGADLVEVFKVHPQARQLDATSEFMKELQEEWKTKVHTGSESTPVGMSAFPVTAVVGLQDAAVTEQSAKSHYETVETIPGTHTTMCKPASEEHPSFRIVRRELLRASPAPLIVGREEIALRTRKIVRDARKTLFITGSRSHNKQYLQEIEQKLAANPSLEYYRVLLGPPRTQQMYDHVVNVLKTRPPSQRVADEQVTFLAHFDDFELQPEIFLCGNERCCIAILPPMTLLGEYSTGYYFTAAQHVGDYLRLTKELCNLGTALEKPEDVPPVPGTNG